MKTLLVIIGMIITLVLVINHPQIAAFCLLFWTIFFAVALFPIKGNKVPEMHRKPRKYDWFLNETGEYVQYFKD
jgi:hypothetical protein